MIQRHAIAIRGLVQGVGFRPYVHGLAARHSLAGFVANDTGGVRIEIEGESADVERFLEELPAAAPKAARIDELECRPARVRGEGNFCIATSLASGADDPVVLADRATCDDCARELFDPGDRRYGYPFLNCTQCGPRLTIIEGAPYDRERTTMAGFAMCPPCRAEYENPADRRFHAQPTACPDCGPRLHSDLEAFVAVILIGRIGALKGLGGYHLVCDATSEAAVRRLRRRKCRDEKPFAVMALDVARTRKLAHVSSEEAALLTSPRRPVVLLEKREPSVLAEVVAPGNPHVGVMLPYTPLHLLLMESVSGRPLVMTSGNRSDEPIVYREEEVTRLEDIADVVLGHDRPIRVRCDDSVTRVLLGEELPLRRSRGYAPEPIHLSTEIPKPILAVGGHLKNTFALGRGRRVFLSHHIGDLDERSALEAFERDIGLYEELFAFEPELLAHDLHPDYASTGYARSRAARDGIPTVAVQHHHAHVAACMAEHGLRGRVLGVAFDGAGFGTDGTIWGGEFLVADYEGFERVAHLRPVALPGGDRAAKEIARMALSYRVDAGLGPGERATPVVLDMILKRVNAPLTSSAGRLFDAVASLLGLRQRVSYEGQAAMELEWLCDGEISMAPYPFGFDGEIDTRPIIRAVVEDLDNGVASREIAQRFHATIVDVIVRTCVEHGFEDVVLSGGVFQNALLTETVVPKLEAKGFNVYRHRLVPPNDGGLALGQIAVAAEVLPCA